MPSPPVHVFVLLIFVVFFGTQDRIETHGRKSAFPGGGSTWGLRREASYVENSNRQWRVGGVRQQGSQAVRSEGSGTFEMCIWHDITINILFL